MAMTMTTHLLRQLGDRRPVVTALALAACLLGATTAGGQTAAPDDSVWLPWLGCWQLVEETGALPDEWADRRSYADRVVVCLNPTTGDNAGMSVEVTTIADAERVLVETLHADGRPQPVNEATCRGERRDTWSSDGARLFTRSALTCEDDTDRLVSGVGLMSDALTWLDIQLVDAGGRSAVTVRRYRRVAEATTTDAGATALPLRLRARAREAAHLISTTELSTDDIIEAQDLAEQPVVEALMVETDATFDLDGRGLLELDDAGVPSDVIDLMVALSFPDWFHVDRPASRGGSAGGGGFTSADPWGPYGQAGFHDWYPFYASPFGYYYGWSAYDSLYYLNPYGSGVVLTDGRDGGRRAGGPAGRAYAGRGYSSIGAREPSQVSERRARRRGSDPGAASVQSASGRRSGGSTSSTSQGGGRATSGGYSRGGSTGRTARPR
jgi:hypothetical protein